MLCNGNGDPRMFNMIVLTDQENASFDSRALAHDREIATPSADIHFQGLSNVVWSNFQKHSRNFQKFLKVVF